MPMEMNKRFLDIVKQDEQLLFFEKLGARKDIQSLQMYLRNSQTGQVALKGKDYESLGLVDVSSGFVKGAVKKLVRLLHPVGIEEKMVFQTFRFDDYSVTIRYIDSKTPFYMMSVKR